MDSISETIRQGGDVIADIRNKLTPIKNLLALLYCDAKNGAIELSPYIRREMEQVRKSIEYLSGTKEVMDNGDLPKYKKIPIIITKWNDVHNGWRAEIADNYNCYKPDIYENINFEDITFHFKHNTPTHPDDNLLFLKRKDAVEAAMYCNKNYLNGKAKIWFIN